MNIVFEMILYYFNPKIMIWLIIKLIKPIKTKVINIINVKKYDFKADPNYLDRLN